MPKTVNLVDSEGTSRPVNEGDVQYHLDRGWHRETADEHNAKLTGEVKEDIYGGAAGTVLAGTTALARGMTGGLSDAALRALAPDEVDKLRKLKEYNPITSTALEIAGSALPGSTVGKAAGAVGKLAGGVVKGTGALAEIGSAAARFAGEGAVFGLGSGVSELALSDHPLTAEHIASTLSSSALLGAGIGGITGGALKAGEKALLRASAGITEATAAKTAIDGIPADIASLDEKGLREAMTTAKAEHAADIAAERKSIESLRVEKRAELANQIRDFHTELATERPIFKAVAGEDVRAIQGIGTEVASPLNKSYRTMRAAFDNPIAIAENPERLLQPLQMQQTALENLQTRMPELQAKLAGDARAAALDHVEYALEQNKEFQQQIRSLTKSEPLQGTRLSMLESGPSQKMQAIESAREALKNAPELGAVAKAAQGGAFAGGTALAHMIPGVGIAAPFLGKGASELVGKVFEHFAGANQAIAARTAEVTKTFLAGGQRAIEKASPAFTATAEKTLSSIRFGSGAEPKSQSLPDLFKARSQEIRQQTEMAADGSIQMRPEARMAMAQKLAPVAAVNPKLADQIETVAARKIAYESSKLPKRPDVGGLQIGPDKWQPSDLQMRSWARTVRACEDPGSVEDRLLDGKITPEEGEAYRAVYPERFAALQQAIVTATPTLTKTLPMKSKLALSVFTGVPLIPALQPNVLAVLQGNYDTEPGSAGGTQSPAAEPRFGKLGSLKSSDKPTPAQARENT